MSKIFKATCEIDDAVAAEIQKAFEEQDQKYSKELGTTISANTTWLNETLKTLLENPEQRKKILDDREQQLKEISKTLKNLGCKLGNLGIGTQMSAGGKRGRKPKNATPAGTPTTPKQK